MGAPLSKAGLLARMRAERARWEALLAGCDEATLTVPGAEGDWSVKDVVGHLMVYQREFARAWARAPRGEPPPPPDVDLADLEQRNAWLAAQQRDRSLADVLAEWRQVGDRLLARVEACSDEDVAALVRVTPGADILPAAASDEGDGWRLADLIEGQAYGHPSRHYAAVRAWLADRARATGAGQPGEEGPCVRAAGQSLGRRRATGET